VYRNFVAPRASLDNSPLRGPKPALVDSKIFFFILVANSKQEMSGYQVVTPPNFRSNQSTSPNFFLPEDASVGTWVFEELRVNSEEISLGSESGLFNQRARCIAIGSEAGEFNQGTGGSGLAVAVGYRAGQYNQQTRSVAVGADAGRNYQTDRCVAVGRWAGLSNQGTGADDAISGHAIAVGPYCGQRNQHGYATAVGVDAGYEDQQHYAVAVGAFAGDYSQSTGAVAIGANAGYEFQSVYSVAVGMESGQYSQGNYSVAIGYQAGQSNQAENSIVLNANGTSLDAANTGLFVKPVRELALPAAGWAVLFYNPTTGEIAYQSPT
jgi:hypothetical protein